MSFSRSFFLFVILLCICSCSLRYENNKNNSLVRVDHYEGNGWSIQIPKDYLQYIDEDAEDSDGALFTNGNDVTAMTPHEMYFYIYSGKHEDTNFCKRLEAFYGSEKYQGKLGVKQFKHINLGKKKWLYFVRDAMAKYESWVKKYGGGMYEVNFVHCDSHSFWWATASRIREMLSDRDLKKIKEAIANAQLLTPE